MAPDTGALFSCSIYSHERNTLSALHWRYCAAWTWAGYLCQRCVAVQIGHKKLRTHYLSDGLCTLITRTFNDLEVGRVGLGRTEKLVRPSDLVDFCNGKIFPCVVFPAKEPCMQTTILEWHISSSVLQSFLACPTTLLVPGIQGKKRTKGSCGPGQTRVERISCSYGLTSESFGRECLHRGGLRLYARKTVVYENPYT